MYQQVGDEILAVTTVISDVQAAEVGVHHAWAVEIHVTYDVTTQILRAEYRAPLIEGTEWQGQVLAGEDRPMLLSVDDSAPRELQPAGGVVVQPLTFEHPDTYTIRLTAAFPCAAAELEVTIA